MKSRSQVPVAVFLTSFHPGGTERQMVELARRLDPSTFTVHFACFRREGAWLARAEDRAASIAEFPIRGLAHRSALASGRAFAGWCRSLGILVVQTCDLYANIVGLLAAGWANVAVRVGSRRELNPDKSSGQIRLQRLAYATAHAVVANSAAAARVLEDEGVPPSRIEVIRNGLDPAPFRDRFLSRARARSAAPTIVTVANLRPEKRHETLFAAMRRVAERHPQARLLVVGDGPRRGALESMAREMGLGERVRFLGHCEQIADVMAEADIFALASISEASPNGVIEAMAAGLPVVATDAGGIPELVADGRTGILVPIDDAEAMAAALVRLMDDPALGASMGRAARHRAIARHSFDRMARAFEDLYLTKLESRAGVPGRSELVAS